MPRDVVGMGVNRIGTLDEINVELKQAFRQFAYGVDLFPDNGSDRAQRWLEIGQKVERLSKTAIGELERDFRVLLGDEGL